MLPVGPIVDVRNLRVAFPDALYGERTVVDGVSFSLDAGDTLALVGESGCGKTLSALALVRLLPANAACTAERLALDGVEVLAASEQVMGKLRGGVVGVALQEPASALNPVRTIGAQVAEAARLHLGSSPRDARAIALSLLDEVGMGADPMLLGAYPFQLSGGQRQRALLACALSGSPRVLIADEPTSSLDAATAHRIMTLLARLHETRKLALVLISHDLPLVARAVSWVAVLYAGETVEIARREDLFAWPSHPYTTALVEMMPRRRGRRRTPLPVLPGSVAKPMSQPAGCRFAPRCPHAFGRCREARPALVPIDHGRWVRCFLFSSAEHGDG
jgi:oligopeptide/dipeptide ABC transporter ATP-binding protein